tara:strand:- start:2205 stop:2621 length:417 start_codon:yes stop_codon:yes gene_type:complete
MTSKNVFFDTNILCYAFDKADAKKQEKSKSLIAKSIKTGNGNISTQVLQEFYVVATIKLGISPEMTLTAMDSLEPLKMVIITPDLIRAAVKKQSKFLLSFWDALILQAAESSLSSILYTEDLNPDQVYGSVTAVNPFA